jgi:uncharacterized membrane protein
MDPRRVKSGMVRKHRPTLPANPMKSDDPTAFREASPPLARVMERNIEALLAKRRAEEQEKGPQERIADAVTGFTGSMACVYLHLVGFALWIIVNLGWTPLPRFDPTFVILAMFASVEAIFLSTFVLITQNRMQTQADRRADLNLQISLLAEHEITQLIKLVHAIAGRTGVEESADPQLAELKQDVVPEQVLDKLNEAQQGLDQTPIR